VTDWELDVIGTTSRASVLVYLGNGNIFVGSHQGDSQFIRIKEGSLETVQILPNIAPILDFAIMEMGNRGVGEQLNDYSSGQARIVTGSGAFQDGSLRSIRNGIRKQEHGLIAEMAHIAHVFSLRSASAKEHVDVLLVSFVDETRILQFSVDGEIEEKAQFLGLLLSEPTLLAANISHSHILQVTRSRVRITDSEDAKVIAEWESPLGEPILAASANIQYVVLSVGGVQVVVLDLLKELCVTAKKTFNEDGQIACLHIPMFSSDMVIVGFWRSAIVAIFKLDSLEPIIKTTISEDSVPVPRTILLTHILPAQPPTLLIAMANGEIITFSLNLENFKLSARNTVILGTQPASFEVLRGNDGLSKVFAICDYPSLIYASGGRIVYSAIPAEEVSCVCAFDSEAFPGAVAIATTEDLRIATVGTQRTTHIQTLFVDETVRRVAYSPSLGCFGLGTIQRSLRKGREIMRSYFKLADHVSFNAIDSYAFNEDELVESVIVGDFKMSNELVHRFVIGTAFLEDQSDESLAGRIMVFSVTGERVLQLVTQLPIKGACRALDVVCGDIVAALVKTVRTFSLQHGILSLTDEKN
jgi:DNA damage-binding protein 1